MGRQLQEGGDGPGGWLGVHHVLTFWKPWHAGHGPWNGCMGLRASILPSFGEPDNMPRYNGLACGYVLLHVLPLHPSQSTALPL